jgi:hypothetical protein
LGLPFGVLGGTSLEQVKFSNTALSAAVAISSTTSASPEALLTLISRAVRARDASLSLEEVEIWAVLARAPLLPVFFRTWPFFGIAGARKSLSTPEPTARINKAHKYNVDYLKHALRIAIVGAGPACNGPSSALLAPLSQTPFHVLWQRYVFVGPRAEVVSTFFQKNLFEKKVVQKVSKLLEKIQKSNLILHLFMELLRNLGALSGTKPFPIFSLGPN